MELSKEDRYIRRRLRQARKQAREFYYCRKYSINPKKIVFTTIKGTTGFCNSKYMVQTLKNINDIIENKMCVWKENRNIDLSLTSN